MKLRTKIFEIFHGLGKGIFLAFILFTLPVVGVFKHYDRLNIWYQEVSDLPIFDEMQENFLLGGAVMGNKFLRKTEAFYRIDSIPTDEENLENIYDETADEPIAVQHYWERRTIEADLKENLGSSKQKSLVPFLDYIEKHRNVAISEMLRTKIPASITLAQGLLEGNAGRSFLAAKANNHFGIKCRSRPGFKKDGLIDDHDFAPTSLAIDCVQRHDDNAWDRFEVYASVGACYRRHSQLLLSDRYRWMIPRYQVGKMYPIAQKLYGHDVVPYYAAWSLGLKTSGYATSKSYAEKLTMIIETYQLWKIDYEALMD